MALTNFTEDEEYKSYGEQACAPEIREGIHNQLICLSVINSFLSITAFLENTLILVALHKESSLHAPSKLLFRTLATTDLCVGIILEPLVVTGLISTVSQRWNIWRFAYDSTYFTGFILCSVSLFTLTAISVDRLLALLLGLRYRQVVTLKRIYVTLAVLGVLSIVGSAMYFLNPAITLWFINIALPLCLVTSVVSHVKIFFFLRHQQAQVQNRVHQGQLNQTVPLNIARYRKTVSSAMWVQLALVVCYLPHGIVMVLSTQKMLTASVLLARECTVTLLYLNSSLNPILYCWKIRGARQAVKDTMRHLCCSWI